MVRICEGVANFEIWLVWECSGRLGGVEED